MYDCSIHMNMIPYNNNIIFTQNVLFFSENVIFDEFSIKRYVLFKLAFYSFLKKPDLNLKSHNCLLFYSDY